MKKEFLYEVLPIRLFLIFTLVFYHAFAIFSGAWNSIPNYPNIPIYSILDKLSYACLLETFVFISGYVFGYQVRKKGESTLNARSIFYKKFKRLIIPSIFFSIIYIAIFGNFNQPIYSLFYQILAGAGHMWFLPMLLWCFVGIYIIEKLKLSSKTTIILLLFSMFGSFLPLPFQVNSTLYYIVFFWAGYYIMKSGKDFKNTNFRIYLPISAVLFISAFLIKLNQDSIFSNIYNKEVGGGIIDNQ